MDDNKIKILFADDHNLVRKGIISLLDDVEDMCVVGEATNGYELVEQYRQTNPDIVISDISMPELSGTDAAKLIIVLDKNAKILFLSMYGGDDYVFMVLNAGGCGLIDKSIAKEDLINAINIIYKGGRYFGLGYDDEKINLLLENYKTLPKQDYNQVEEISSRELDVLKYVCEGLSSKEIAEQLSLSSRTVESHKLSMMKKLNLTSSTQLIKYAIEKELFHK